MMLTMSSLDFFDPETVAKLTSLAKANVQFVLPLVALVGFMKSTAFVTMFVPSTTLFFALAAAYTAAGGTFLPMWGSAALGAIAGDALGFALGYRYRRDVANMWPLSESPELLPKGEVYFQKWGVGSVLGAKFVWGIRPFIPVIAGIYRMPLVIFLGATSVSSMVWAAIGMGLAFGAWQLWS